MSFYLPTPEERAEQEKNFIDTLQIVSTPFLAVQGVTVQTYRAAIAQLRTRAAITKIARWIIAAIFGAQALPEVVERVRKKLSTIIGETVETFDYEGIKNAVGRVLAKKLGDKLFIKYGIDCPIDNLASETIFEEIGEFSADVLNDKLSLKLGKDVVVVTTFFPPDDVVDELDTFLTDEINLKLGLNVSSILLNDSLLDELKTQIVEKLQQELVNNFNKVKGTMVNDLMQSFFNADNNFTGLSEAQLQIQKNRILERIPIINSIFEQGLELFSKGTIFGYPINAQQYYARHKKKIANKMRQRQYRKTHVEKRVWIQK